MQKKKLFILIIFLVLILQIFFNNFFHRFISSKKKFVKEEHGVYEKNVLTEKDEIKKSLLTANREIKNIEEIFPTYPKLDVPVSPPNYPIPVLVLACDRVTIKRALDSIIAHRPSESLFPLIVSQDCDNDPTKNIIQSYDGVTYLKQPNQTDFILPAKKKKLQGYFRLSRHYRWALNQVFKRFNYNSCIIVEDDLEIAPDFFEYFIATKSILESDPSLYCVSAWNDNGIKDAINKDRNDLIFRTDFFPGLGWLMLKTLWLELEPNWPDAFWDDWLRAPEIRKERSCLRPEVSRVFNFGEQGVSRGLHYKTHLVHIVKNEKFFKFSQYDLKSLKIDRYSELFLRTAYAARPSTYEDIERDIGLSPKVQAFRIKYTNKDNFKPLAKKFHIMSDALYNMPRNAFRGVVPLYAHNKWIFLCPPYDSPMYSNFTVK